MQNGQVNTCLFINNYSDIEWAKLLWWKCEWDTNTSWVQPFPLDFLQEAEFCVSEMGCERDSEHQITLTEFPSAAFLSQWKASQISDFHLA